MNLTIRAYEVEFDGGKAVYTAKSPGNAKYKASLVLVELGYFNAEFQALAQLKVRRRSDLDGREWTGQSPPPKTKTSPLAG